MAVNENQIIEFKHNFEAFAKELEDIPAKQFRSMFKRAMTRALRAGSVEAKKQLGKRMRKPKSFSSFKAYFDAESVISGIRGNLDEYNGSLTFKSKRHGLAQYITDAKLKSHRKAASKMGYRKNKKKPKPLEVQIIPGKKVLLRKAFAGKKGGAGSWQVYRRKEKNERLPLDRPTGPSLASKLRATPSIELKIRSIIKRRYFVEFRRDFRFRTDQALRRAGKK